MSSMGKIVGRGTVAYVYVHCWVLSQTTMLAGWGTLACICEGYIIPTAFSIAYNLDHTLTTLSCLAQSLFLN